MPRNGGDRALITSFLKKHGVKRHRIGSGRRPATQRKRFQSKDKRQTEGRLALPAAAAYNIAQNRAEATTSVVVERRKSNLNRDGRFHRKTFLPGRAVQLSGQRGERAIGGAAAPKPARWGGRRRPMSPPLLGRRERGKRKHQKKKRGKNDKKALRNRCCCNRGLSSLGKYFVAPSARKDGEKVKGQSGG